jgi:hypothetical protein
MKQQLIARAVLFLAIAASIWLAHSIEQANKDACHGDIRCVERLDNASR